MLGVLTAIAIGAAVAVGCYLAAIHIRCLLIGLPPAVAIALIGAQLLIATVTRAIYRHTAMPRTIAFSLAFTLSSGLFMLVTTAYATGRFMTLGLDSNFALPLLSVSLWTLAVIHTLYVQRRLAFVTAASVAVALLLLSYSAVTFLYNEVDWQSLIAVTSSFEWDDPLDALAAKMSSMPELGQGD
jgi:hypothetical protein